MSTSYRRLSRRQELGHFTGSGRLRQAVEGKLSREAIDLLIDVVERYCAPKPVRSLTTYDADNAATQTRG